MMGHYSSGNSVFTQSNTPVSHQMHYIATTRSMQLEQLTQQLSSDGAYPRLVPRHPRINLNHDHDHWSITCHWLHWSSSSSSVLTCSLSISSAKTPSPLSLPSRLPWVMLIIRKVEYGVVVDQIINLGDFMFIDIRCWPFVNLILDFDFL